MNYALKYDSKINNKNIFNNQNYISSDKIKISLLFEYFFIREIWDFSIAILNSIIKFFLFIIIRIFYKKIDTWFYNLTLHLLLVILVSPILFFLSIYFSLIISFIGYIMIYLYFSNFFLRLLNNFSFSKVHILGIINKNENKFFKFDYISSLIENVTISEEILNNTKIFFKSLFYSYIANLFLLWFYLLYLYLINA